MKKMNTYVKYGLIILCSALIGAVIGGGVAVFRLDSFGETGLAFFQEFMKKASPWLLGGLAGLTVLLGEYNLIRQRGIAQKLQTAEDEEADALEDAFEALGSWGMILTHVGMALAAIFLASVFAGPEHGEGDDSGVFLIIAVIFILLYAYDGFWQVRMVKTVQKAFPQRLGDPASRRFQKDWLESCDEAEREIIYRSAYRAYLVNMKLYSVLLAVALFGSIIWETGILAVVLVGVAWCTTAIAYCRGCVINRKRLREK